MDATIDCRIPKIALFFLSLGFLLIVRRLTSRGIEQGSLARLDISADVETVRSYL